MSGLNSIVLLLCTLGLVNSQYEWGKCPPLPEPVGTHPRTRKDVPAGRYDVKGTEDRTMAATVCDVNEGWILMDDRYATMSCTLNKGTGRWEWEHQSDSRIPQTRCAYESPKPIVHDYNLGPLTECMEPTSNMDYVTAVTATLEDLFPCAKDGTCRVGAVTCTYDAPTGNTTLQIRVVPTALKHVKEQKFILDIAAGLLREYYSGLLSEDYAQNLELPHHRRKRLFEPEPILDPAQPCDPGSIHTTSDSCVECTKGTYADTSDPNAQVCGYCPLDTYSLAAATECLECDYGLGTLQIATSELEDCIAVCDVPDVWQTINQPGGDRIEEGGEVYIQCLDGWTYGNTDVQTVTCNSESDVNDIPASCRQIELMSMDGNLVIAAGETATLICTSQATDIPDSIAFSFGSNYYLTSGPAYTVGSLSFEVTETYSNYEIFTSSATLEIKEFDSTNSGEYTCLAIYSGSVDTEESLDLVLSVEVSDDEGSEDDDKSRDDDEGDRYEDWCKGNGYYVVFEPDGWTCYHNGAAHHLQTSAVAIITAVLVTMVW